MFEPQLRRKSRWASKFAYKSFWDYDESQKFLLCAASGAPAAMQTPILDVSRRQFSKEV